MIYYKYLDLNFQKTAVILLSYFLKNRSMFTTFWTDVDTDYLLNQHPEIQQTFDPLNIRVKRISIIITDNTSISDSIHRDYTDVNVRINIPILNCNGSITNFYKSDVEPVFMTLPNGMRYEKIRYEDCKLVDSFCLNKPAALRVKELHQVIANPKALPRISATIDFIENIDYMLE